WRPARPALLDPKQSSLTWCLTHLSKPPPDSGAELDKRSRFSQWRALVAIRTQHIKGDKAGITRFRKQGGLRPLLDLLGHHKCSRKTLDLALSILANCCTELETRKEVSERNILTNVVTSVDVMKRNVAQETIQNRAARALGNLAMDSESSALIHLAGESLCPFSLVAGYNLCAQSASRALLYLSDTPANRLSLLTQGALSALTPLMAPEYPQGLRRAALRTLHELTRGCGPECAREVSRSGVAAQLSVMASGEAGKPYEELALKTLANLCSQGCLRPLVGSLGVIPKFTAEAKKEPYKSGVFLKALCLCCKEAVNRAKVKESGGLEALVGFLAAHPSHPLARLVILACVDFVFDESAVEQLQELGLVPLLVARLVALTAGEKADAGGGGLSGSSHGDSTDGDWAVSPPQSSPNPDCPAPLKTCSPLNAATHPYHPEPWTPESPVLLLLSRFSHAADPSPFLVTSGTVRGLLCYLSQHQDPSSRCFRLLCRLTCNPSCLRALLRTGAVALIHHHLCQRDGGARRQQERVGAKVKQLGVTLLNNLHVQCESAFGAGVLAHVMLSGSESDRVNCALSLPLIIIVIPFSDSNKFLLRKLLLDSGSLLLALQPLGCLDDTDAHTADCRRLLSTWPDASLHSLYFSLLIGCLSPLVSNIKLRPDAGRLIKLCQADSMAPPPAKKPRQAHICTYASSDFDLLLVLDDGAEVPANKEAVAGSGSEYFRALLKGGFGEAKSGQAIRIKDVTEGMLVPVLHHLHGCRLAASNQTEECQFLDSLILEGLRECQGAAHLGADAEVFVGHKFRLLVRVRLHFHVGIGHAHAHAGQGQHKGQDLPGPRCGKVGRMNDIFFMMDSV
uniref:Armadillo repeat containing 5 n=1 Tax=Hippocampus comes TaxID=109280 RepID=A0A3Q2YUC0_HIPCM